MGESKRKRNARREWEAARAEGRSLGDAPVEERYHQEMIAIVQTLDELFNGKVGGPGRKTGFVLIVFPFDEEGHTDGRCNYMSNGADRNDIVVLMKEMIARFEGQPETKGSA